MFNKEDLPISTTYNLQVNKAARKLRHKKLVTSMGPLRFALARVSSFARSLSASIKIPFANTSKRRFASAAVQKMPLSVQNRLYKQIAVFSTSLVMVMSFAPSDASFGAYADASVLAYDGEIVIADDEGYLTKFNPQTFEGDRSTMSDSLTHVVESGETLSAIGAKYGLKMETIMWENGMYNAHSLKVGQEIVIPPADGLYHEVKKGEVLSKIATKYKIEADLIAKQNSLEEGATLSVGQELFIPGAKGKIATPPRSTYSRVGSSSRSGGYVANHNLPSGQVASGTKFIWPTSGKVTQGYHGYHHALDIAKYPGGPIWAAAGGKVVKVQTGTYAGGYGNHVIVDHGGGLKTLYAHMEYVSVKLNDQLGQGAVLGKMGRTGRVYGRTGIHLHFEVWKNGVKQNPWNYF